ncbi:MAG TPA: serine hydrolase domain-containing protein [Bryobacteraceae bacterium]|jgi:CubicO group peptidase (beta-lactamase class C family)|nr:serine hydrolase domain-containing protein [Bryobacteraceae bacterium]
MNNPRFAIPSVLLCAAVFYVGGAPCQARPGAHKETNRTGNAAVLPVVKPEMEGFSAQRLDRLHGLLRKEVEDGHFAGIVTALARHGKIVDFASYGKKDLASGASMTDDTIFRIYSMTKPITGVAMMILYEQGKWSPGDPISKYIPEFAHLKVFKGSGSDGQPILEDPAHPPTMGELMSHNAGFTYGIFGSSAVDKMYRDAKVLGSRNLQEMVDKLARIPLLYQPGTKWVYSVSVDIQGYIVEKLSGKPLGEFMRENIFQPLGMKDTAFHVDEGKRGRFATLYSTNASGELSPTAGGNVALDYRTEPGMPSGGGGLTSTTSDYLRFAQMLLNGGELGGVRILAPSSVALMRTNRLSPAILNSGEYGIGFFRLSPSLGFGFDFAVYIDPGFIGHTVGKGTFTWGGAAGTWFWIDPANDIVFVGMVQRIIDPKSPDLDTLAHESVYQALVNPER